jgi:hypothetical protein
MVFEAALAASDAPMNSLDHHDRADAPMAMLRRRFIRMALALNYRVGQSV